MDTGLGSNTRDALEGDGGCVGWWLCDECEERSMDCFNLYVINYCTNRPCIFSGFFSSPLLVFMRLPHDWFWNISEAINASFIKMLDTVFHFLF